MTGVIPVRGHVAAAGSRDLIYHGGPVMTSGANVTPICWGTSWSSDPQNKKMNAFYNGMSGSSYAGTNGEYTQTGGRQVGTTFTVNPAITDLSNAPKHASKTSVIFAEVGKLIANPVANGYYPV